MGPMKDLFSRKVDKLIDKVSKSKDLSQCKELSEAAGLITETIGQLAEKLEIMQFLDANLKEAVNNRATQLYGKDWEPIEGDKYRVLRVLQGSVYVLSGHVDSRFTKQTISVDSPKTTEYLKKNGRLPDGIEPNKHRTERITITLK